MPKSWLSRKLIIRSPWADSLGALSDRRRSSSFYQAFVGKLWPRRNLRDVGLKNAKDLFIARYAQDHQASLLTGDFGFADIRNYLPESYYGIVVLELPQDATAIFILHLIEEMLGQNDVVTRLGGRLGAPDVEVYKRELLGRSHGGMEAPETTNGKNPDQTGAVA